MMNKTALVVGIVCSICCAVSGLFACGLRDRKVVRQKQSNLWLQFGPAVIDASKRMQYLELSSKESFSITATCSVVEGDKNFGNVQSWATRNVLSKFQYTESDPIIDQPNRTAETSMALTYLIFFANKDGGQWDWMPLIPDYESSEPAGSIKNVLLVVPLTEHVLGPKATQQISELKKLMCEQDEKPPRHRANE